MWNGKEKILKWEFESRGALERNIRRTRIVLHCVILGCINSDSMVLSVGCGTGFYELQIRKYTKNLFCLDVSNEMLQICKERNIKNLIRASSLALPFKPETFDCVYALSLSPISSDASSRTASIREMNQALKANGNLVIGHPATFWKKVIGLIKRRNSNYDLFRVSSRELEHSMEQNHIGVKSVVTLLPMPYFWGIDYTVFDRCFSPFLKGKGSFLFVSGAKKFA